MATDSTICQKLILFTVLLHSIVTSIITIVVLSICNCIFLELSQLILKDWCQINLTNEHGDTEEDVADRFGFKEHLTYLFRCEIDLLGVGV